MKGKNSMMSLRQEVNGIINGTNEAVLNENANKNKGSIATRRDLIAGAAVKDYALGHLPHNVAQAHKEGRIHIHDLDYMTFDQINCSIPNIKDMFDNGTVISDKLIETPKSLHTAATVLTQIIAQVASSQYGGTTINNVNELLAPYMRASYEKHHNLITQTLDCEPDNETRALADALTRRELRASIQTINYQISTLTTSNGQTPFITMSLRTRPDFEFKEESNAIVAEILDQRTRGILGKSGHYETQVFPKLIFFTNEHNVPEDSEFHWLLRKSAACTAARMYPDYVSEKIMRRDYEGQVFAPMGCRAFLTPYYVDGVPKVEGRFNKGVTTINLPMCALRARRRVLGDALDESVPWNTAGGDSEKRSEIESAFWEEVEEALNLLKEAQMFRVSQMRGTKASTAPILWQHGGIARLDADDVIDPLLYGGYSTLSIGYVGIYETCMLILGESNTTSKGEDFATRILETLEQKSVEWNEEEHLGWSVYGTPSESLVGRFGDIIRRTFGDIEGLLDSESTYLTNSFHVNVRQPIDAFSKIEFESHFQPHSKGGAISYVEMGDLRKNVDAVLAVITHAYENILYAEFNSRSENICLVCDHEGELPVRRNEDGVWGFECPKCGNRDNSRLIAVARMCGYLGDNRNGVNDAKLNEFGQRVIHI